MTGKIWITNKKILCIGRALKEITGEGYGLRSNQGFSEQVKQTPARNASGPADALNEPLGALSKSMIMQHITYRIRISLG